MVRGGDDGGCLGGAKAGDGSAHGGLSCGGAVMV